MQLFLHRAACNRRYRRLSKRSRKGTATDTRLLTVCAWCERVRVAGRWLEMDDAISRLRTFEWAAPPDLTHGICEDCYERLAEETRAAAELGETRLVG